MQQVVCALSGVQHYVVVKLDGFERDRTAAKLGASNPWLKELAEHVLRHYEARALLSETTLGIDDSWVPLPVWLFHWHGTRIQPAT